MSRSPLFRTLRRILERAALPEDDQYQKTIQTESSISRRDFLKWSAASVGCVAVSNYQQSALGALTKASHPSVAIIGGGIAGLSCAYQLRKHGIISNIYEANTRVAGRMFTARGYFPNQQSAEFGGEFIDSAHSTIRGLARELGLFLDDLTTGSEARYKKEVFFINGRVLEEDQLVASFRPLAHKMAQAVARSDNDSAYFAELDAMGIVEWLNSTGVADSDITSLLATAYTEEYGLDADQQSVFNLLYLIDHHRPKPFRIYGDSDERFHIRGGNDQLPHAIARKLHGQIELGAKLVSVRKNAAGRFIVGIQNSASTSEKAFDIVVFALPFTLLRQVSLDLDLPPYKQQIIQELGYGTNVKLITAFETRVWHQQNSSGYTIADNGLQACWDSTRKQRGKTGVLTLYQGGASALALGSGNAESQVQNLLPLVEQIYPGAQAHYVTNSGIRMFWPTARFVLGSYACYKRGQAAFSGNEGRPVGNLYFCGEHCSVDFQGFMEGGCETGTKVANQIMKRTRRS